MAARHSLSPEFITDLNLVCEPNKNGYEWSHFLKDLDAIHQTATFRKEAQNHGASKNAPSTDDLKSLASAFDNWRAHHQRLLEGWLREIPDDDPIRSNVSLFGTMDFGRLETAHTRTLAWLLGDNEHGFGFRLLQALLQYLTDEKISDVDADKVESEYSPPGKPCRMDIFAKGRWKIRQEDSKEEAWILAIEAKVGSAEGADQLSEYDKGLDAEPAKQHVLRIFLTPDGRACKTHSKPWRALSFSELAGVFRSVPGLENQEGYPLLRYYVTGVLRDVCRLPVPIRTDCKDPYSATDYLRIILNK